MAVRQLAPGLARAPPLVDSTLTRARADVYRCLQIEIVNVNVFMLHAYILRNSG